MDGVIKAEWDPIRKIVMHRPGMEMFFGLIEPYSSLYERAFSRTKAVYEHQRLQRVFENEFGVEVLLLKDAIVDAANKKPAIKKALIELAKHSMEYVGDDVEVERAKKSFEENTKYLDTEHYFNLLLINPSIRLRSDEGSRNVELNITKRQPLANLYFMRDQQFVTEQGIVLCRMAKPARRNEPKVTKFLWETVMGLNVLHEITAPGTIEGGEFIPMGNFAMVGIGDRTNRDAIDQLLSLEFNYEEIAVVHQPMHPLVPANEPDPMINMHLDTYFNVASKNVVVGCEVMLENAQVEIYKNEGLGQFKKENKQINLKDYIKSKGFDIINVTSLEQMSYASNFLCMKDGRIVAVEVERNVKNVMHALTVAERDNPTKYGKLLAQIKQDYEFLKNEGQFFPHKKEVYQMGIEAYPVNIPNLTGGYGAAHCMTCALERS